MMASALGYRDGATPASTLIYIILMRSCGTRGFPAPGSDPGTPIPSQPQAARAPSEGSVLSARSERDMHLMQMHGVFIV